MEDFDFEIRKLKESITRLLIAFEKTEAENKKLYAQNHELHSKLAEVNKKNEELENKNLNLQLTRNLGKGAEDNESLRIKLDEMISDIDHCITFLEGMEV